MEYLCIKKFKEQYTRYELCGDKCCDVPVDDYYYFYLDETYDIEYDEYHKSYRYDAGRGLVYLCDEQIKENFQKHKDEEL